MLSGAPTVPLSVTDGWGSAPALPVALLRERAQAHSGGLPGAQSWSSGCRSLNSCPGDPGTRWGGTRRAQTPPSTGRVTFGLSPSRRDSELPPARDAASSLRMPPSLLWRPWVNTPLASSRHYPGYFGPGIMPGREGVRLPSHAGLWRPRKFAARGPAAGSPPVGVENGSAEVRAPIRGMGRAWGGRASGDAGLGFLRPRPVYTFCPYVFGSLAHTPWCGLGGGEKRLGMVGKRRGGGPQLTLIPKSCVGEGEGRAS